MDKLDKLPKGIEITDAITKHIDRRYLNSIDLIDAGEVALEIEKVEKIDEVEFADGKKEKNQITLWFKDIDRPLRLCRENIKLIVQALKTNNCSNWKGKKIVLAVKNVKAFGKVQPAVRVVGAA